LFPIFVVVQREEQRACEEVPHPQAPVA
jgi:hypothetical protein